MLAPGMGLPEFESTTVPETVVWANVASPVNRNAKILKCFFMGGFGLVCGVQSTIFF
jgi:hypothetical protein